MEREREEGVSGEGGRDMGRSVFVEKERSVESFQEDPYSIIRK